jgi:hypothetical protein
MFTSDTIFSINPHDFVKWIAAHNNFNPLLKSEYVVFRPYLLDDYLQVRILASSDENPPNNWHDYEKRVEEWHKEMSRSLISIVVIKNNRMIENISLPPNVAKSKLQELLEFYNEDKPVSLNVFDTAWNEGIWSLGDVQIHIGK